MKPILLSTPMVRAILEGRKTMTRRVVKPQPEAMELNLIRDLESRKLGYGPHKPGEILWVRETWQYLPDSVALDGGGFVYKASENGDAWATTEDWTWRPSIFMPKEAARIFLRVTDVRLERLQEISDEDIAREGVANRDAFHNLWDSLRKPADRDKYGWAANPWVWVISFERCGDEEARR